MPLLMREGLGYPPFHSKQEALLAHGPLAASLGLPPQFPFSSLPFPHPPFLTPPTSSSTAPVSSSTPSPILQQHALLSAFSQNMKQGPKLWWSKILILWWKSSLNLTQVPKVDFKIDFSMQTAFYVIDMILYIYEPLKYARNKNLLPFLRWSLRLTVNVITSFFETE